MDLSEKKLSKNIKKITLKIRMTRNKQNETLNSAFEDKNDHE